MSSEARPVSGEHAADTNYSHETEGTMHTQPYYSEAQDQIGLQPGASHVQADPLEGSDSATPAYRADEIYPQKGYDGSTPQVNFDPQTSPGMKAVFSGR
jgi:hypothetical protein